MRPASSVGEKLAIASGGSARHTRGDEHARFRSDEERDGEEKDPSVTARTNPQSPLSS